MTVIGILSVAALVILCIIVGITIYIFLKINSKLKEINVQRISDTIDMFNNIDLSKASSVYDKLQNVDLKTTANKVSDIYTHATSISKKLGDVEKYQGIVDKMEGLCNRCISNPFGGDICQNICN